MFADRMIPYFSFFGNLGVVGCSLNDSSLGRWLGDRESIFSGPLSKESGRQSGRHHKGNKCKVKGVASDVIGIDIQKVTLYRYCGSGKLSTISHNGFSQNCKDSDDQAYSGCLIQGIACLTNFIGPQYPSHLKGVWE
jgi:hypothetical protein